MIEKERARYLGIAGALTALLSALPLIAAPVRWDARHATGGVHRPGTYLSVAVRLINTSGKNLRVELRASAGTNETRELVDLPRDSEKRLTLYPGRAGTQVESQVELLVSGEGFHSRAAVPSSALPPERISVGIVGGHPMGWSSLREDGDIPFSLVFLKPELLPDSFAGLESLDVIVWPNPNPSLAGTKVVSAISAWVGLGGTLVLPVGGSFDAAKSGAFRQWTATEYLGASSARALPEVSRVLGALSSDLPGPSPAITLRCETCEPLLRESSRTLAVEERRDLGRVIVLGLDPTHPNTADWPGLPLLWRRLLRRVASAPLPRLPEDPLSSAGAIVERFENGTPARKVPALSVAALFFLYLAAIGPIDYLVQKRLRRNGWTWIALPGLVLLFSGSAALLAGRPAGREPPIRTLEVRDLLLSSGQSPTTTHFAAFSPRTGTVRISGAAGSLAQAASDGDSRLAVASRSVWRLASRFSRSEGRVEIQAAPRSWNLGSFTSLDSAQGASVTARLNLTEATLSGRVVSNLGQEIKTAYAVTFSGGPRIFQLGRLKSREPTEIHAASHERLSHEKVSGAAEYIADLTAEQSLRTGMRTKTRIALIIAEMEEGPGALKRAGHPASSRGSVVYRVPVPLDSVPEEEDFLPVHAILLPSGVPLEMVGIAPTGGPPRPQEPYYIGRYEVTVAQWQAVMGTLPPDCDTNLFEGPLDPAVPVTCVSLADVVGPGGFIEKLHTHLKDTCQSGSGKYRLPDADEWVQAAGAGTSSVFFFLGEPDRCTGNCAPCPAADPYVWWCGNSGAAPHAVGKKLPNPYGLHDVNGNVEEMALTSKAYGRRSPGGIHGGSFRSQIPQTQTTSWHPWSGDPSPTTGFRLARYR